MPLRFTPARVSGTAIAALSLLLCACRAPGMKLNVEASAPETRTQMQGLSVTLRPLNAETIRRQPAPVDSPDSLVDLLAPGLPAYRVGPQDILMVTVWDHPELTLPLGQMRTDEATGFVVDEEGCLYYPHVGRFQVKGLTVVEVREKLTAALNKVLRNPQVDVKVLRYRSQQVFVGGEVRNAGLHSVTDVPFSLAEAVNRAGGFLPTADTSRITLARGEQKWTVSYLDLVAKGNRLGRLLLRAGDTVHVAHRDESPVYVMGELRNPKSVPLMHGRLSLAQALSEAGGIMPGQADPRSIYVLRRGDADSAVEVYHLDAGNPVAMVLADRFPLQPRDMVFVDAGSLVRWNRVVSLLLPTVSALTNTASDIKFLSK